MIFITDRDFNILTVADNTASKALHFYDDEVYFLLEKCTGSFTVTFSRNHPDAKYIEENNLMIFQDRGGKNRIFTIMEIVDDTGDTNTIEVTALDAGMDLLNETVPEWIEKDNPIPIAEHIKKMTYDSGWVVGVNEIPNLTRSANYENKQKTFDRLLSICHLFDNAEMELTVEIRGNRVTRKLINIFKKRGSDRTDIRLAQDKDVQVTRRTRSIMNLCTALLPVGGTPEPDKDGNEQPPVDISDIDYPVDENGIYSPKGDKYIYNTFAKEKWQRPGGAGKNQGYIVDFFEYDTQSNKELFNRAKTQLEKRSDIEYNFELTTNPTDEVLELELGDYVLIVNHAFNPSVYLKARVLELAYPLSNPKEVRITFGNFLILEDDIDRSRYEHLLDLIDKIEKEPGKDGLSCYLTKETMSVPADKDGNIDSSYYQYMKGNFVIVEGNKEVTPQKIEYEVLNAAGCSGHINVLKGEYVITNFYRNSSDAKLNMRATYNGVDFNKTFTVTKSKEGQIGPPGKPGQDGKPGEVVEVQSSHIGRYPPDRPVKGMVWFQTGLRDGMETVIAIKDYTGSEWVERQINHEPIHIDKLSALTADIGVITAGAISTPDIYIGINRGQINIFDTSHDMEAVMENGQLIFKESTGNKKRLTLDKYGIRNEDYYFGKRELNFVPEGLEIRAGTSNVGDRKNSGLELIGDKSYIDFHTGFGTSSLIETDFDARIISKNRNRGNSEGGALIQSISYGFDLCVEDDVKIRTFGDKGWNTIRALEFKPNSELKHKNILEKYNNGLEDLRKIDFYEYSRDDGDSRYLGLITDYVKDKLPIIADEEGVSLYSLVSLVGQGLKELDKKTGSYMTFNSMVNDKQNEKIKELERKNNELEERLSKLEALYG